MPEVSWPSAGFARRGPLGSPLTPFLSPWRSGMPANGDLPKRVVCLELLASILQADGGEGGSRFRLIRDFPWLHEQGWQIERWGLRRPGSDGSWPSLRGPRFPFHAFPRVFFPPVVW